jgi:putative transposase
MPHHSSQWAAIGAIAAKLGCAPETLRRWMREADKPCLTPAEEDRLKVLEWENREFRRAHKVLRLASAFFVVSGYPPPRARPPYQVMYAFVDAHRHEYGVEPICWVLEIAPSVYYSAKQGERHPSRCSPRRQRDAVLREKIWTIHAADFRVNGMRKTLRQLRYDGELVARFTVEPLMGVEGLQGVVSAARVRTARPAEDLAAQAADLVQRQFTASRPNQLWVADFMYVATWIGFVYVAFVIDVFSHRIVGWRA